MPVSILTSIEQLSNEDIAMLSYENQKNFFKSIEWFSCLTKSTHEDDVSVKLYIVSSGNDPLQKCYLFCYIDKKRRKLSSLSNFYTMEFSVIFSLPQCQKKELLHELSSYIAKEIPANNFIKIQCLYDGIEETNLLYEAFCSSNYLARLHFFKENYFVNVRKKSFNDYYELRPSALTNTIRRKKNKLNKNNRLNVRLYNEYNDKALSDYVSVYESSWKDGEKYENFIKNFCLSAAQLGILRMGILYIDEDPVAAQIWLLSGTKAIIYKLAYDSNFQQFSVGSILTKEMAEFVINNDDLDEVDYGLGSENYKKDWMDDKRVMVGIYAFNLNTVKGKVMAIADIIKTYLRKHFVGRRS